MKSIIELCKKWRRNSPGFTLVELMVAMAVGSFVMGGVFTIWTQLFHVTAVNSNYMTAFRQVQNGGDWISRDALMTQQVYETASTTLSSGISDTETTIPVASTDGFPAAGAISIEDELIQYTSKTANIFENCTRGSNATAHDDGKSAGFLITLGWAEWSGDQHQLVYNIKEISRELVRSHYVKSVGTTDYVLNDTSLIAEAIVVGETYSDWDYNEKELKVQITASVGSYILGRPGVQSETATRTYKVHPRPLF